MMQGIEHRLIVRDCIEQLNGNMTELSMFFYTHLFRLHPPLQDVFNGGAPMLNRKFNNMLATLKNIKHLEKIAAALTSMAERHLAYHAEMAHFPVFKTSLLLALHDVLGASFSAKQEAAWSRVFDEVSAIMIAVFEQHPTALKSEVSLPVQHDNHLLHDIGGEANVRAVHQRFYDMIYDDDFLGRFFHHRAKHLLVKKQTEFMVAAFGGINHYRGEPPAFVHMHMFITQEMSDIRDIYLRNAILAEGLDESICQRWLAIDRSFHASIEKTSEDECVMRCWGQQPTVVKKPTDYSSPIVH
ncbi:MAG: globin domain-containing protein [Mariprofundaceae bacterium]|nr:globin domain-containing protein [Mariprofundaceae bacterium]